MALSYSYLASTIIFKNLEYYNFIIYYVLYKLK